MGQVEYECEECGYELTALAVEARAVRCPECGRSYEWPPPLKRQPMPGWWRLALWMCGPTAGVVALTVVWTCLGSMTLLMFWPLVLFGWIFALVGGPAITASDVVRRHVLRPRRWRARWVIQLAGVAGNLFITGAAIWVVAVFG